MALDVVDHRFDRGVTLGDRLLQRLQHDGVEIAAQRAPQFRVSHGVARPGRLGGEDRLFERSPGVALEPVRARAGEQLEQQHAEAVDVGPRADRLAGDLLRRGVVGCQHTRAVLREFGHVAQAIGQQLGDAEVEQLDLTLRIDEQV